MLSTARQDLVATPVRSMQAESRRSPRSEAIRRERELGDRLDRRLIPLDELKIAMLGVQRTDCMFRHLLLPVLWIPSDLLDTRPTRIEEFGPFDREHEVTELGVDDGNTGWSDSGGLEGEVS